MSVTTFTQNASNVTAPGASQTSTDYIELLGRIHRHLLPRTYAEIGVCFGKSLALSLPRTRTVGVDPEPRLRYRVSRSTKIIPLTSDDFFGQFEAKDLFGDTPLDLAFIDGMHLFEFALRDFINLEKWCSSESVILVHDCYPIDEPSTARVRTTRAWTGDVWKLVTCLKESRPDLNVSTIKVPPSGLCVITGLDPSSRVLESKYAELCRRYVDLNYSMLAERTDEVLNAVPNDWRTVRALLPGPFQARNAERLELLRSLRLPHMAALRHRISGSIPAFAKRSFLVPLRHRFSSNWATRQH